MPVKTPSDGLERGLGAMSQVLSGYMHGEQVKRTREVEEREYGFRREQFDESTRQFDDTFEEGVRQFDTRLAFQAEQSALLREHQVFLQDDSQDFAHEEQALERASRETHQGKQRGLEYWKKQRTIDMQNADRALQAERNSWARYKGAMGNYSSWSEVPGVMYGSKSKKESYDPLDIDVVTELENITLGNGSDVLSDNLNAQTAQMYLDMIAENGGETRSAIDALIRNNGFHQIEDMNKEAALMQIVVQEATGGDLVAWEALPTHKKDEYRNATIHKMNHLDGMERRAFAKEIENDLVRNGMENGDGAYGPGGAEDLFAQSFGLMFRPSASGYPVPTGLGGGAMGYQAKQAIMIAADMRALLFEPGTDDQEVIDKRMAELKNELKDRQGMMTELAKDRGLETDQVSAYGNWLDQMAAGGIPSMEIFGIEGEFSNKKERALGTADGVVPSGRRAAGGPRMAGGFLPGTEQHARQLRLEEEQKTFTQGKEATRKAESETVRQEDNLRDLAVNEAYLSVEKRAAEEGIDLRPEDAQYFRDLTTNLMKSTGRTEEVPEDFEDSFIRGMKMVEFKRTWTDPEEYKRFFEELLTGAFGE